MNKECAIVQDLIPLVNDGVASQESQEFVLKHCKHCQECQKMLDIPFYNEESLNQKWYKKLKMTSVVFLILFVLLTCSFHGTRSQFQNFIFMPIIGCLGYWLFHKRVYFIYLLIFISSFLIGIINGSMNIYAIFCYILLSWLFISIGIIIYLCFQYAFSRR